MSELDEALDKLLGAPRTQSIDQHQIADDVTAIDPDTFEFIDQDGKRKKLRLGGAGGPEIMQIDQDTGTIKRAQATGDETHRVISQLAQEEGFSQVLPSGEQGAFGRELGDIISPETGESLTARGLETGILQTSRYSSQQQSDLAYLAEAERKIRAEEGDLDKWDAAGILLNSSRNTGPVIAKPLAATPWEYASNPGAFAGTQLVSGDRYFDNTPKSWLGVSGELGGEALLQGAYGTMDIIGTLFGDDDNYGEAGNRALAWEQRFGPSAAHMDPFDAEGNWKLDSFGDYAKFVIGTGLTSLPQMGVTIASLFAAPFTAGATLAIPATIYTGQTWNEMDDPQIEDIPTAMIAGAAQGALDLLGVGSIGLGKKLFTNKSIQRKVIQELMEKNPGMSQEAAETLLTKGIKRELAKSSENYRDLLRNQLLLRNIAPAYGVDVALGAGGEALTEAAQETIASVAAHGWDSVGSEEWQRRIITAAVGGGFLGGVFATGGFGGDIAYNYDALRSYANYEKAQLEAQQYKERDKAFLASEGRPSGIARDKQTAIQDTIKEARQAGIDVDALDVDVEAAPQAAKEKGKNVIQKLRDYYKYRGIVPGTTQGSFDTLAPSFKGRGRIIDTVFNSWGKGQGHSGPNNEEYYNSQKAKYSSVVNNGIQDEAKWGLTESQIDGIIRDPEVIKVAKELAWRVQNNNAKSFTEAYVNAKAKIPNKYSDQTQNIIDKIEELEMLERAIAADQGKAYTPGSFHDWRALNKEMVEEHRSLLAEELAGDTGLTPSDVSPLLDRITQDETYLDSNTLLDEILEGELDWDAPDHTKTRVGKARQKIKEALADEKYAKYQKQDLYFKQESRASAGAAQDMFGKYYGADGKGLVAMLKLSHQKDEITKDEYEYLAWEARDQFKIMSNEYKVIDPNWRVAQNHLMFMSTVAVLPLATASSLVEAGVLTTGLTPQQLHGTVAPLAKNLATETAGWMNGGATKVRMTGRADYTMKNFSKALNKNLGFENTSASARARAEATGNLGGQQKILDGFFKAIFLQPWTNVMRMTAAGLGGDVIYGWIQNVAWDLKYNDGKETVLGRESKEALIELGLDPDELMYILDSGLYEQSVANLGTKKIIDEDYDPEALEERIQERIRFALIQFVNSRVANPSKTNRPKLYYDPRFRLFMHFQGFISAFTSEILPKLYKNLVRGTPGLKYQAFATLMSMLTIAFLSQMLKDELKYGEPSPWLTDWKLFQRTLYSSGLLGVGERAIDLINPLYGGDEGITGTISSEAPALRYLQNIGESVYAGIEGDTAKAVRSGSKAVPLLGPFYGARRGLGELAKDLFDGEY